MPTNSLSSVNFVKMGRILGKSTRDLLGIYLIPTLILGHFGNRVSEAQQKPPNCANYQFECTDGLLCVDRSVRCDGLKDCADASDEAAQLCANRTCSNDEFRCNYGACVSSSAKCDGRMDCVDNSDENNPDCPKISNDVEKSQNCPENKFQCQSGKCIEKSLLCDGKVDCEDNSDESIQQCENNKCPSETFRCEYGGCIKLELKCNENRDCLDGSDERSQLCYKPYVYIPPPNADIDLLTKNTTFCVLPAISTDLQMKFKCPKETSKCVNKLRKFVAVHTELKHRCSRGYGRVNIDEILSVCWEGNWLPDLSRCDKLCPPLEQENLDLFCSFKGEKINCKSVMLKNTMVRPRCKPHFHETQPIHYRQIYCESNGKWTDELFKCVPECGKPLRAAAKLIALGEPENFGEGPWYAAIYQVQGRLRHHICGGTIISQYLIVSAAHCFYDENRQKLNNVDMYEVAVSKYTREYSKKDNRYTKMYKIQEILLSKEGYTGFSTKYTSDIAILRVKGKIALSRSVLPACVPWTNTNGFNARDGTLGKISGLGLDENGSLSEVLMTVQVPFIRRDTCIKTLKDDFKDVVTLDKFCAGSVNGSGAREGDSGGGLLFRDSNLGLYYLQGVISVKDKTSNSVAVLTSIHLYLDWMDEVRNRVENEMAK